MIGRLKNKKREDEVLLLSEGQGVEEDRDQNDSNGELSAHGMFLDLIINGWTFSAVRIPDMAVEIIEGAIFSRLGRNYLAADGFIVIEHRVFATTALGVIFGLGNLLDEVKDDSVRRGQVFRQIFILALALSIPVTALLAMSEPILIALGQNRDVAKITGNFYIAALVNTPFYIVFSSLQLLFLTLGRSGTGLKLNFINNILSVILSGLLALGSGSIPQLNEWGMGLGRSLSSIIMVGVISIVLYRDSVQRESLFSWTLGETQFFRMLKLGLPYGVQVGSDFLMQYVLAILLGRIGKNALAEARVADMVYMIPFVMLARSPQIVAAHARTAKENQNQGYIKRSMLISSLTNGVAVGIWILITSIGADPLLKYVFDLDSHKENDSKIISGAKFLMFMTGITLLSEVVRFVSGSVLRGLEDTVSPMINSIVVLDILGITVLLTAALGFNLDEEALYGIRAAIMFLASMTITAYATHIVKGIPQLSQSNYAIWNENNLAPLVLENVVEDDIEEGVKNGQ
ncbi:MAG: MATE family efflux transporter [Gammaproteobacteria bacterium]